MSETAASAWPIALAALQVRDRQSSICILRVRRVDSTLAKALGCAFDVDWPLQPNTTAGNGYSVLWMAPGQWAIVDLPAASVVERTARACGAELYHVADVSDGRVRFEVSGAGSRDLLAKGCSLDLHPRVFRPSACAQTLLAQTAVLLFSPPGAPGAEQIYRLYADVSVAQHLRRWFQDAALEWGATDVD